MKKFTAILLCAMLVVPFISSCSKDDEGPTKSVLATILPFWNNVGFAIQVDDGSTMYPGKVRINYKAPDGAQRAIIHFSEINEPVQGFTYNIDIHNIQNLETKDIKVVTSSDEKLSGDGIEIVEAFVSGGYLNIEYKVSLDPYAKDQNHVIDLIDNMKDGEPVFTTHYPLELRFRRAHSLQGDRGETFNVIACFYLGKHSMSQLGCQGYELKYTGLGNNDDPEGSEMLVYKVTPATNAE